MSSKNEVGSSSSSSSSSSTSPLYSPPSPTSSYIARICDMKVDHIVAMKSYDHDYNCVFCNVSVHMHAQSRSTSSTSSTSTTSSQPSLSGSVKFDIQLTADLPKWKKTHKLCTPFFAALELQFSIYNVHDDSLKKRYLQLTLNDLHDHEKQYAHQHITHQYHH